MYILDPLEDLISKSRHGQSGGVAVGMGLLSTILAAEMQESPAVTGTFVGDGQDDDALEVVISLRHVSVLVASKGTMLTFLVARYRRLK